MLRAPVPPPPFCLFSRMTLPPMTTAMDICADEIKELVDRRAEGEVDPFFDETPDPVGLDLFPFPRLSVPLNLKPVVPIFMVDATYDLSSGRMEEFCRKNPICIIRGLMERLSIDLSLFSLDSLSCLHPTMSITMNTQTKQEPDVNLDERGRPTWEYINEAGECSLKTQAVYMKKEEKKEGSTAPKRSKKNEEVYFGVAGLSEFPRVFDQQLQELHKLPSIFKPCQATDLHTLMGFEFDGLTGVYAYMKVAGVRTTAHEEDGGVPSVNVAVGPGSSEWMATDLRYVKDVEELAKKKGLEYPRSSLWPDYKELERNGVPIIRFSQLPGDLVYTGAGTLHWVQGEAMGVNIAWGSGELSTTILKHFKWQTERNRVQGIHCSIPILHTAWRVAAMGMNWDENVHFDLRSILIRSLSHLYMIERWLVDSGLVAVAMSAADVEDRFHCDECEMEVFNLVFSTTGDNDHCFYCMMKKGGMKTHTARRQRPMTALETIFDSFRM